MKDGLKNIPTVLVVYGATGDLMRKKIVPALFHLFNKGELPDMFRIIGFSRRDWGDMDFRAHVREILVNHFKDRAETDRVEKFIGMFRYQQGQFSDDASYSALHAMLAESDAEWGVCSNKLFYLAVPPSSYEVIFNHLASSGLTKPCSAEEGWTRIIVEKPFGDDLKTARALDETLSTLFQESQIYRIDHYLAKEMLQNIMTFRFANNLFELAWDNRLIESIHVCVFESIGVEHRGAFYERVGALRDVGQNHLLQMLALVMMDHPESFDADAVRGKRAEIMTKIKTPTPEEIKNNTSRAQYTGYREITGVAPNSEVETYFKVTLSLDTPRWRGVPLVIESGKRLGEPLKEIVITFKHPSPCLCPPDGPHHKNEVIIRMEPHEEILIEFWSKRPGLSMATEKKMFNFMLRDSSERQQYTEEYEKLLLDCIRGDQTLFVSTREIREMWRIIDPIVAAWKDGAIPLTYYEPDGKDFLW